MNIGGRGVTYLSSGSEFKTKCPSVLMRFIMAINSKYKTSYVHFSDVYSTLFFNF